MRRQMVVIAVLAACAVPMGGRAAPNEQTFAVPTTAALSDLCADIVSSDTAMLTAAQNFCHGYMLGAYQVLEQVNAARGKPAFCIPSPSPSRNQAIAEFVAWVQAHPSEAQRPPVDGVYEFLTQQFPCPAKP